MIKSFLSGIMAIICLLLVTGCAHDEGKSKHDLFYDKWQQMAKESKGYSPEQQMESEDLGEEIIEIVDIEQDDQQAAELADKPLPTKPVTIQIYSPTPIQEVLRLLAKGADQNIVISPKVKGQVTVNLKNVPWKDVFESILKNNGFTYVWEGDILRVLTLADLEQDQKLKESETKRVEKQIEARDIVRSIRYTKIVKIKYADIQDLQQTLVQALGGDSDDQQERNKSQRMSSGSDLAGMFGSINSLQDLGSGNGNASRSSDSQLSMSAPKGTVIADQTTNSLILRAGKNDMEMLMQLINYLDKPPFQVHIKAHIVETTKDTGRSLGVQWGGVGRSKTWDGLGQTNEAWIFPGGIDGSTGSNPAQGDYTSIFETGKGVSGQGFGLNFPAGDEIGQGLGPAGAGLGFMVGAIGGNILELQLSALEKENKAHILSSPSITTMDNQKAYVRSGAEVPYISREDGDTSVEFKDAELKLDITPHVIEKDLLKLSIKINKDEVDLTRTVEGNPLITTRETETSLAVRSGETVVISGLSKETVGDSNKGVPWLKDIPGLGKAFGGETSSNKMEELLIFITPNILDKRSEAKNKVPNSELTHKQLKELESTNDPEALKWVEQSKALLQKKNLQEAVRTATIAIALDPGLAQAYACRSQAYVGLGKDELAFEDTAALLYFDPKNSQGYALRAQALESMGYEQKALKAYEKSCALGSEKGCREHKRLFYELQSK